MKTTKAVGILALVLFDFMGFYTHSVFISEQYSNRQR
jgi:hypothetical protein